MAIPELELVWDGGSLDLLGENETPYGPVLVEALAEGTEWGKPETVRRALFSLLADGSASVTDRHDNRTVTVKLRLSAADSSALAGGEAPLHMLAGKRRAELRWTPPNDYAAPAAFTIVASDLAHDMDDLAENRVERFYTLTLTCLPFALSLEPVVIEALPPFVAAPAVLDACSSTTGWASFPAGSTSVGLSGGNVMIGVSSGNPRLRFGATLTKPLTLAKRFLAIEGRPELVSVNGGPNRPPIGVEGVWRFFDVGPASISTIKVETTGPGHLNPYGMAISTIGESDSPALTGGRQSLRAIPTPGSARTAGSLSVEARNADTDGNGDPLGQVIVYSGANYDPRLSPYATGTRTSDTLALSGSAETSAPLNIFVFRRPVESIPPGSYSVLARAKGANAQSVNWTFRAGILPPGAGTSNYLSYGTPMLTTTTFTGTAYNLFNLGTIDLPGFDANTASGLDIIFPITATASPSITLDEVLLCNRTTGRLTVIDTRLRDSVKKVAGNWTVVTNGGATRLWMDAPTVINGERIIAGSPSKELSLPVSLASEIVSYDGAHLFTPDATFIYVATTGSIEPKVTGNFRPAWHTHPAQ